MLRFIKNDPGELAAFLKTLGEGLVIFDGRPSAGKSHMARIMRERVPCKIVDTDDFIIRHQKTFLGALKIDALRASIMTSLRLSPLVVLSGVCGRWVVENVKLPAVASVWVEKSSLICIDIDERDFVGDHHADLGHAHPLYAEVENYVATYDPRSRPDVVYLNAPD